MTLRTFRLTNKDILFYIFCIFGVSTFLWMVFNLHPPKSLTGDIDYKHVVNSLAKKSYAKEPSLQQQQQDYVEPMPRAPLLFTTTLSSHSQLEVQNRLLLITKNPVKVASIKAALLHLRLPFTEVRYSTTLPPVIGDLTTSDKKLGLYSVIIFDDLLAYYKMDISDQEKIKKYCRLNGVAMILFTNPIKASNTAFTLPDVPLTISTGAVLNSYRVEHSPIIGITRPNMEHSVNEKSVWKVFTFNHSTYTSLCHGFTVSSSSNRVNHPVAVLDSGRFDGVKRAYFGHAHSFWLHKILFLDVLSYMTGKAVRIPRDRFIQIDIDDVFLGSPGTKMNASDAQALKKSQDRWRESLVPGFSFFLGYVGFHFGQGLDEEIAGDEALIELRSHFKWFDHMYEHAQAHKLANVSSVIEQMTKNKLFAQQRGLTTDPVYSVAPHHSGVYPVHEPLYEAWRSFWNISVTSTEEYPHLKPPWVRRGFVHRNISVLPRQVCGLYTSNLYYEKYPGGRGNLEYNIFSGDLFESVLYNKINIYMTHQQNYAHDRLSLYTFDRLFRHFNASTTLKLKGAPPAELARIYFREHPKERRPVWGNPCADKRHVEIWSDEKSCQNLPGLIIVGPQKTGTTALYQFLKLHPNISSNRDSESTFEELQFFGTDNYLLGLDWYLSHFSTNPGLTFEKSATYFDNADVPRETFALLPNAEIVTILLNPIDRAFSWYHHQRAHNDTTALSYSFYDIITSSGDASSRVKSLRSRLLRPSLYMDHIRRWTKYYPDQQMLYVDGEELKIDPVTVMVQVQKFINVDFLDYSKILRYDEAKGFYCWGAAYSSSAGKQCLGPGKGRSKAYGSVDDRSKTFLSKVFLVANAQLRDYLVESRRPLPGWLSESSR